MNARRRATAVLEMLGIYLAGQLVAATLAGYLAQSARNPLETITASITDCELIAASRDLLVLQFVRYAGWLLLIVPISWWHGRTRLASYGLSTAGRSWASLLTAGLATAALVGWPVLALQLADARYDLGETAPWRQALFDTSWRRWEFWLFTAILSWGIVAVLEELFFRGYCQSRLAEDWGDGPAILGTAGLFTFAHSQYLFANAHNTAMIASLLLVAIGLGVVSAWTQSLIPAIAAHAIINVPMTPRCQAIVLAAALVIAALTRRRAATVVTGIFDRAGLGACAALGAMGAVYAVLSQRIERLTVLAAGMVVLAVALDVRGRQRERPSHPSMDDGVDMPRRRSRVGDNDEHVR